MRGSKSSQRPVGGLLKSIFDRKKNSLLLPIRGFRIDTVRRPPEHVPPAAELAAAAGVGAAADRRLHRGNAQGRAAQCVAGVFFVHLLFAQGPGRAPRERRASTKAAVSEGVPHCPAFACAAASWTPPAEKAQGAIPRRVAAARAARAFFSSGGSVEQQGDKDAGSGGARSRRKKIPPWPVVQVWEWAVLCGTVGSSCSPGHEARGRRPPSTPPRQKTPPKENRVVQVWEGAVLARCPRA